MDNSPSDTKAGNAGAQSSYSRLEQIRAAAKQNELYQELETEGEKIKKMPEGWRTLSAKDNAYSAFLDKINTFKKDLDESNATTEIKSHLDTKADVLYEKYEKKYNQIQKKGNVRKGVGAIGAFFAAAAMGLVGYMNISDYTEKPAVVNTTKPSSSDTEPDDGITEKIYTTPDTTTDYDTGVKDANNDQNEDIKPKPGEELEDKIAKAVEEKPNKIEKPVPQPPPRPPKKKEFDIMR